VRGLGHLLRASHGRRGLRGDPDSRAHPGSTAYLWDSGEHRCLFTGDSIEIRDGEWRGGLLGSGDRDAFIDSLERVRQLDIDLLVPWATLSGQPIHAPTDRTDARRRIDAILKRVRRGKDG
jgi:hypothetical protein